MAEQDNKIQEMQLIEQNLQNILMQKQAFQMELTETSSALAEINKSSDKVYKIVGQLMIQTEKKAMVEELKSKEKILDLRIKSIEKQEKSLTNELEKLRDVVMKAAKK